MPLAAAAGAEAFQAPPPDAHCGPADPVRAGLDVVAAGHGPDLAGKRIGLLAHGASVTRDGRHAIDVLRESSARVVRIFAPEHGLRGQAAAGEAVDSNVDPASGAPVVSLYGEKSAPEPADLAGLDALVIDVQDVGVRFYTYLATMGWRWRPRAERRWRALFSTGQTLLAACAWRGRGPTVSSSVPS